MRLDPEDPKVRWATFGRQVEDFLQSDIGDYLLRLAKAEELEALEALATVSPWRTRRIRELQNKALLVTKIQYWLGDAIASGHAAMEQIKGDAE
jgi:hypothetical protein